MELETLRAEVMEAEDKVGVADMMLKTTQIRPGYRIGVAWSRRRPRRSV